MFLYREIEGKLSLNDESTTKRTISSQYTGRLVGVRSALLALASCELVIPKDRVRSIAAQLSVSKEGSRYRSQVPSTHDIRAAK